MRMELRSLALVASVWACASPAMAQQRVIIAGDTTGSLAAIETAVEGTVNVNVAQINGATPLADFVSGTLQSAAVANGNGTTLSVNGYTDVIFSVNCSVSCAGGTTINFEGTEDGTNYEALARTSKLGAPATIGATVVNQASGTITLFRAPVAGLQAVRARISAYSAGTITITGRAVSSGGPEVLTIASLKPDGTNAQPSMDAAARPGYVTPTATSTAGATTLSFISAGATEDEHAVCTAACTLYSVAATNVNAAVRYLKCENDTAAGTAPGTDTPEFRLAVPGATTGGGFTHTFPVGAAFSTGLTCWLVTGAADSDVAEVAANELMVFYTYKQ
jgi:hypothetical protein